MAANFIVADINRENWKEIFSQHLGEGDLLIDFADNVGTRDFVEWCADNNIMYLNTGETDWPDNWYSIFDEHDKKIALRESYQNKMDKNKYPIVLQHGNNPGLVSHFVKAAIDYIIHTQFKHDRHLKSLLKAGKYNEIAQHIGLKMIHVNDIDLQKVKGEFKKDLLISPWCIDSFWFEMLSEATFDAGTHEDMNYQEELNKYNQEKGYCEFTNLAVDKITMEVLQRRVSADYSYTNDFSRNLDRVVIDCGINMGYFQKANWKEPKQKLSSTSDAKIALGIFALAAGMLSLLSPWQMLSSGLLIVGAASITTGIYVKKQAHKYVLFTESGEMEYRKWRGLYNFLNSDTLIKDKTFVELPLWEKYLVYATAFDIADKVIAAIKIRCPEAMAQTKSIVHNPYCRSSIRLRHSSRSFRSSVHRGRSGGSFGGGGGFGYGGGGRGGGGGGGGH